ncbi:OmcA/MtrC family decaheme c-type cytochrome [Shewanella sp. Isolate11]|uniref:OmcA/MtrC family decaheme c-type cytochrome n=1 Tax=Shewanella sp. Isolate11 TaxID=2908530 RepID=UPI001EFC3BC7|nr:OmcA/MtrC family decaheme c-type cytochrome [Shewanella sp. Isolate11]MCG9696211.1 OmcA/MtrC family decaheme c-type cytochrome [Shewanella sp. Isolate11]
MKTMTNLKRYGTTVALAILLTACGGDDGEPGEPGEPGGQPAVDISSLHITFSDITMEDGVATVNYRVSNQDDDPVVGIPSTTYIAAQLLPQGYTGSGDSSQWQFFTSETCPTSCVGEYTDHKNGYYSYQFSAAFDGMNNIEYQAGSTQRLVIKLGGDSLPDGTALPLINEHYDWQAPNNGESSEPTYTRNLIKIETCNTCHNDLAFHRGRYNQVETCVSCHNADHVSNPENIFPQMIHSKHLTGFPGSVANCQTCHAQDDTLPENANWAQVPTMEACGSCHTAIDFKAGQGHPAQANNSNCVACHNPDWTASAHNDSGDESALEQFKAEITAASLSGDTVSLTLKLSNPATGTAYTDSADKLDFLSDLRVYANWGTSFDYSASSGSNIRLKNITPISGSAGSYNYEISGLTVPAGSETDTGVLAIQGRICAADGVLGDCADTSFSTVNIKSSHQFFNAQALTDSGRRVVVTNETCGSCHGDQQLNIHGSRNDLEGQCQLCHNPNRQADSTVANPSNANVDYKHFVHSIHSGNHADFADINYPGNIGNCGQCHTENNGVSTVALPLISTMKPLAIDDGTFTSPTAAICSDCHLSDAAKNHMTQQGAVFMGTEADATAGTESCATCHGQGSSYDVLKVHPIQ